MYIIYFCILILLHLHIIKNQETPDGDHNGITIPPIHCMKPKGSELNRMED